MARYRNKIFADVSQERRERMEYFSRRMETHLADGRYDKVIELASQASIIIETPPEKLLARPLADIGVSEQTAQLLCDCFSVEFVGDLLHLDWDQLATAPQIGPRRLGELVRCVLTVACPPANAC